MPANKYKYVEYSVEIFLATITSKQVIQQKNKTWSCSLQL